MPLPGVKDIHISGGFAPFGAAGANLDPALKGAREGVLAMFALSDAPADGGAAARIVLDASLGEEEYTLEADEQGARVRAGGAAGAVHAAATIAQLCLEHGGRLPCCALRNAPYAPWRGLLLDVSRHFFGVETVKKIADLLAFYRFNRLHLHLSDDQGFRMESERFPLLNTVGSVRESTLVRRNGKEGQDGLPHGGFYTKAELRELVRYCKARGIEIVPEIDMPGHALAILAAYPELACFTDGANPIRVATRFGVTDFSKILLCAGNEKTYEFLCSLLDEVMEVFPFEYVHLGGDEAVKENWERCPKCQAKKRELGLPDERELQGWFLNRMKTHLLSRGRRAVVWNDGLCNALDKDFVCQYWTPFFIENKRRVVEWVNRGGRMLGSAMLRVYFDYPYAATPLRKTFFYNPVPRGVKKRNADNVLGTECAVWTEWIDTEEKLFFNLLPRLSAAAESGWSAPRGRNWRAFLQALPKHYALYARLGLPYARHAERTLPLWRRLRIVKRFLKEDTHVELGE